jgi:hypothetical protein
MLTLRQVIDGLPIVNQDQKPKLIKFLLKKLNTAGKIKDGEGSVFMPMNDEGMSEGYGACPVLSPSNLNLSNYRPDLHLSSIPPLNKPSPRQNNSTALPSTRNTL